MLEPLDRKAKKRIYRKLGLDPDNCWIERPAPMSYRKPRDKDDWVSNFDHAYARKDNEYSVMIGLENWPPYGILAHLFIRQFSNQEISWANKQHILHTLFGHKSQAFEVFPPTDELVDLATVYHLWVIDPSLELPSFA